MSDFNVRISEADWAKIHAKAWLDDAFRHKLETDPTAALREFAAEYGLNWGKLVHIEGRPASVSDDHLRDILAGKTACTHYVPACC